MLDVDTYLKVRTAVQIEGLSKRAAARRFGIDPKTVAKMMSFSVPPGYVRSKPPVRPKLDPFTAIIDKMLADDKSRPKKQQHTSKRIFERLRDEHAFTGGITIVKDYVAGVHQRAQEMFVPLVHPPGHAQADFGEALAVIGGVEQKIHYFAFDLPHSDANFVVAVGKLPAPVLPRLTAGAMPAALATRAVHFATGTRETPVLARDALGAGTVFEGPAILTQLDATTLVPPDWRVTVDASGALLLHKISIS